MVKEMTDATDKPKQLEDALEDFNQNIEPQIYNSTKRRIATIETIRAALTRLSEIEPVWQPIETAPKDGTKILGLWRGRGCCIVRWSEEARFEQFETGPGWQEFDCDDGFYSIAHTDTDLTHWMPLPSPPTALRR